VISVDTKKKELIGDFKNGGRELRPKGQPGFMTSLSLNSTRLHHTASTTSLPMMGGSSISHDAAAFAVASVRRRWHVLGAPRYPSAKHLLINADCGGSNGNRVRLWKRELQVPSNELEIAITVNHLPPGTSK
jgi:hypothetical protein